MLKTFRRRMIGSIFLTFLMTVVPGIGTASGTNDNGNEIRLRVVAFNVLQGRMATPEQIAAAFSSFKPDVLMLSEAPGGGWAAEVGRHLDMNHSFVGTVSSAHHDDKYKAIVSRTPFELTCEYPLTARGKWNPASVVRVVTIIEGRPVSLYSLHIAKSSGDGHLGQLVKEVLDAEPIDHVVVGGDFNYRTYERGMKKLRSAGYRSAWAALDFNTKQLSSIVGRTSDGLIDHIYFKDMPGVTVAGGGIVGTEPALSDHWPIWTEFRFKREGRQQGQAVMDLGC